MASEWTKDPKVSGAYWYQSPGHTPDIVWINGVNVLGVMGYDRITLPSYLANGGMFYGPLDQPPPMTRQKPEETTRTTFTHHAVAMELVSQWGAENASDYIQDPGSYGEFGAEIYLACLEKLAEKPQDESPSMAASYANLSVNPFTSRGGRVGDTMAEAKCCKGD